MLGSAQGVVVGAADIEALTGFFGLLDFVPVANGILPPAAASALYGVDRALSERRLAAPGAAHGTVRLVQAPAGVAPGPFDRGGHAFDIYSADLDASLDRLEAAGVAHGPVGLVELGPLLMRQVTVPAPGGLLVVLIDANRRRSSVLDTDPSRLHSEGHSVVWTVDSIDDVLPFWRDEAGTSVPFDLPIRHPEVAKFMQLPRADVALRMAMIGDEAVTPMRFELLEFVDGDAGAPAATVLRSGLHAVEWRVASVEASITLLPSVAWGAVVEVDSPVHPNARGVHGVTPGGVTVELWTG